jgi:D-glycero-D-manno-heptose 1,7-bisphosphate phosphatase
MHEHSLRRGLLLDRDGVINVDTGYPHRISECRFVAGIFDLVRLFADHGFVIAILTNQAGIGRGYFGEAEFAELMSWMLDQFSARGIDIARIYHCPDHPTEGVGVYRRENPWRKPGPGMFLQAAADLSLDLPQSWTIGDKASDIEAGRAAGVGTLIRFDHKAGRTVRDGDVWRVPDLAAIADLLRREEAAMACMG